MVGEHCSQNLLEDVPTTQYSINSAFHREYEGGKWFVSCMKLVNTTSEPAVIGESNNLFSGNTVPTAPAGIQFGSNAVAYCSHGSESMWCIVLALIG